MRAKGSDENEKIGGTPPPPLFFAKSAYVIDLGRVRLSLLCKSVNRQEFKLLCFVKDAHSLERVCNMHILQGLLTGLE